MGFVDAVNKIWKKKTSRQNFKKICAIAASSAAPRFYITPRQALDKYNEFIHKGKIDVSSDVTLCMYKCIFDKFEEALRHNSGAGFRYSIMQDVLDSEAPSFFIGPDAAHLFYYRAMAYKRSLARKR